jgi:hypothetical protein
LKTRYKNPRNKKFFHTRKKIDSKDINIIKKNIEKINRKNKKRTNKKYQYKIEK